MRWLMTVLFSQEFLFWEFTIHCRGSEGSPAHLLYFILLFYFSYILVQFLLYPPLELSLFFFFLFILSSFFPIIPNILCQISCHPIHRVFFAVYLPSNSSFLSSLVFFFFTCPTFLLYSSSNWFTNFYAFSKFSLGSQVSSFAVYSLYYTRYLFFPLNFFLFYLIFLFSITNGHLLICDYRF